MLESGGGLIADLMDRLDEFEESGTVVRDTDEHERRGVLPAPALDQLRSGERTPGPLAPIVGADRFIGHLDFPHTVATRASSTSCASNWLPDDARAGLFRV